MAYPTDISNPPAAMTKVMPIETMVNMLIWRKSINIFLEVMKAGVANEKITISTKVAIRTPYFFNSVLKKVLAATAAEFSGFFAVIHVSSFFSENGHHYLVLKIFLVWVEFGSYRALTHCNNSVRYLHNFRHVG